MKRSFFLLFAILATLSFSSCDLDDDDVNFHFASLQVLSVEMPESFDFNETYKIKVTYLRPDDCTFFEGFDVKKTDITTRNVVAVGYVLDKEACTQVTQEVETSFDFVVLYTDTYLFRFWTGEDENGEQQYLEIEVPVNTAPSN